VLQKLSACGCPAAKVLNIFNADLEREVSAAAPDFFILPDDFKLRILRAV